MFHFRCRRRFLLCLYKSLESVGFRRNCWLFRKLADFAKKHSQLLSFWYLHILFFRRLQHFLISFVFVSEVFECLMGDFIICLFNLKGICTTSTVVNTALEVAIIGIITCQSRYTATRCFTLNVKNRMKQS